LFFFESNRYPSQSKKQDKQRGHDRKVGIALTNFYWTRSDSAGSASLLSLQKMLMRVGAKLLIALAVLSAGSALRAHGQTASMLVSASMPEGALPDAPSASLAPPQNSQQTLPFLPSGPSRGPLLPMTAGDKFKYLVEPAFGPRSFFTNAFVAGIRMSNPPNAYPHEWRAGAEGYGRLYGDRFARTGAASLGRFSAATLLHEDPRYGRSGSTSIPARLTHAFVFTFVDRTDGGHTTVAVSNFAGAAASGFIGNAYLPAGFDDLTHAGQRSTFAFGGLVVRNVLQEFSPELGRVLRKIHQPHLPMPPVWWTGDK
jgi:hypothetical protein